MFSQREEEAHILALEGDGRYLSLGEYDGRTFSNVRALAERGWEGVVVEPAPYPFTLMLEDPPPGAKLVHVMVGPRTGLASFLTSKDAVSTSDRTHARKWAERVDFTPIYTVSITIFDLLREFPGPYRVISIDTESTSTIIFHQLVPLLDELETELVCVEHDDFTLSVPGWEQVYKNPENIILRRR